MSRDPIPIYGLKGIRVLDFTWAGAGPFATEILCLLGADVVKVESADRPDLLRVANRAYGWGDSNIDASPCFNDMNAGKRSISLDLKNPAGRDLALRLAACADIVCDNMRSGKMDAIGLGYEQLRIVKPNIISCSVSSTGQSKSIKTPEIPGYAPVFWAEGGAASVTGLKGGEPVYARAPVDMNAATMTALGMLAALYRKSRTGQGCRIDCSAIETVAMLVGDQILASSLGHPSQGLQGNARAPFAPNDTFPCAGDDKWIAISVKTTTQWSSLCQILKANDLLADTSLLSRLQRWRRQSEIYEVLAGYTRMRMAEDLNQELQSAGVAATCCPSIEDLLGHDDLQSRGFWRSVRHSVIGAQWIGSLPFVSSPAIELSDIGGPILGEHTVEVLQNWLAMGPEDIERFESVAAFGNTNVQ